jgi:hypothetical protein
MTQEIWQDLAHQLYERTNVDWHVNVSQTLTEPTVATVSVYSDYDDLPRYNGIFGTRSLDESVKIALEYVLSRLEKRVDTGT